MRLIQLIQCLHIVLGILVHRIFQYVPGKLFILIPLGNLSEFLSHEHELFARMAIHESIGSPQIVSLGLIGLTWHLTEHGIFTMNHLIMREY